MANICKIFHAANEQELVAVHNDLLRRYWISTHIFKPGDIPESPQLWVILAEGRQEDWDNNEPDQADDVVGVDDILDDPEVAAAFDAFNEAEEE